MAAAAAAEADDDDGKRGDEERLMKFGFNDQASASLAASLAPPRLGSRPSAAATVAAAAAAAAAAAVAGAAAVSVTCNLWLTRRRSVALDEDYDVTSFVTLHSGFSLMGHLMTSKVITEFIRLRPRIIDFVNDQLTVVGFNAKSDLKCLL
jgi:hypothetical protein